MYSTCIKSFIRLIVFFINGLNFYQTASNCTNLSLGNNPSKNDGGIYFMFKLNVLALIPLSFIKITTFIDQIVESIIRKI